MYGKCYLALYNSTGGWEASGISVLSQLKNFCFCRWDMTCSRHTFAAATPKEHTPDPWKVAYLRMARHPRISSRACGFRRPISRFFVRSPNEMLFVVARLATSGSSQRTAVPRQRGTSVPAWLHKTRKTLSSQMYLRCYLILVRGKYRKTIHWAHSARRARFSRTWHGSLLAAMLMMRWWRVNLRALPNPPTTCVPNVACICGVAWK